VRILLDECVHAGIRASFPGHSVRTVTQAGWRSSKDGSLLRFAEQNFDIFVTIDGKLERQHNLRALKLGIVIVHVPNNKLESYESLFEQLKTVIEKVSPGEVVHVGRGSR
jgi:predicted nuclease of predicted toxin-antitoxin system